jgi:hypothetical protein
MLHILSKNLKEVRYELRKARWRYDGAARSGEATNEELKAMWDEYKFLDNEFLFIEKRLYKIGDAKVELAKAKWWYETGVHSFEHISFVPLIYPCDSIQVSELRQKDIVDTARANYYAAKKAYEDLLPPSHEDDDDSFIEAVAVAEEIPKKSVRAQEMLRRRSPLPE